MPGNGRSCGTALQWPSVEGEITWVLWAATVGRHRPLGERVTAALGAGYTQLSLSPEDVQQSAVEGVPAAELGRRLRAEGLELVLDPAMGWYGDAADDVLRTVEALGVTSMSAIGPFRTDEVPAEELPARFAAFCDRAAEVGAQVGFEFMPISAIADLAAAWDIVGGADRPNGGVVVDTWHFFRGTPDFDLLATIPGERIFGVQVSDAPAEPGQSLAEETFHRLMPGDGALDLIGLLTALDAIGGLHHVGPEVLSPVTAAMPALDAAEAAASRIRELLAAARAEG
jgi:sugar phosphate isomerase/epimerase